MEKGLPIFDIEQLAGCVGSDSLQFVDVDNGGLGMDSLVPQIPSEIPATHIACEEGDSLVPQVSTETPSISIKRVEGISLDSKTHFYYDYDQESIFDRECIEKEDLFKWTRSPWDDDNCDSILFENNCDRQLTFKEKLAKMEVEESDLMLPWEDSQNDNIVVKIVDEPPMALLGEEKGMKMEESGLMFPWEDRNSNPVDAKVFNEGPVTPLCEFCGKMLSDMNKLKKHQDNLHLGLKPFECDLCGKGYFSRNSLINHKMVHTGEKPFSCEICDKRFRQKSYLKKHIRSHITLYLQSPNKLKSLN